MESMSIVKPGALLYWTIILTRCICIAILRALTWLALVWYACPNRARITNIQSIANVSFLDTSLNIIVPWKPIYMVLFMVFSPDVGRGPWALHNVVIETIWNGRRWKMWCSNLVKMCSHRSLTSRVPVLKEQNSIRCEQFLWFLLSRF